jgi:hypothetical protein
VKIGDPKVGAATGSSVVLFSPMTAPALCCFVSDAQDGWYTLGNVLCSKLRCEAFKISMSLPSRDYPINQLIAYAEGEDIRWVRAMQDDPNWEFLSTGALLPVERPEYYKKRRIRDRLTREILVGYMQELGIDIADDDFWRAAGPAFYVIWRHF